MSRVSTSAYYLGWTEHCLSTAIPHFLKCLISSFAVPISNVTLTANATNLVEFNDTAVFMCSVSNGTSLTYVWLKNGSVVTASGGVQFSDGGAILTIVGVTRYDEGPFRCNVSNGISHEISLPVHLNISCEFSLERLYIGLLYVLKASTPKTISLLLVHQMVQVTRE